MKSQLVSSKMTPTKRINAGLQLSSPLHSFSLSLSPCRCPPCRCCWSLATFSTNTSSSSSFFSRRPKTLEEQRNNNNNSNNNDYNRDNRRLITQYGKCGELEKAKNIFQTIKQPNIITYNAMMSAFRQNGHDKEADELFHQFNTNGLTPNETSQHKLSGIEIRDEPKKKYSDMSSSAAKNFRGKMTGK